MVFQPEKLVLVVETQGETVAEISQRFLVGLLTQTFTPFGTQTMFSPSLTVSDALYAAEFCQKESGDREGPHEYTVGQRKGISGVTG